MRVLAAVLLLASLPSAALADELIRFRTPDGVLGLVDHEDKVPPGATILSRDPKPTPAARVADPGVDAGAGGTYEESGPLGAPRDSEPAPARRRRGPSPSALAEGASPDEEAAAVAEWCEQSTALRREREDAEADVETERERFERCELVQTYCSERDLDAAEQRLEDALTEEEAIADECRRAECLPGWIREGCEALP
jgi:hypothetical protein